MKKILTALSAFAVLSSPALAADMAARPYTKAPVVAAYAPSWTGCYIGGGGGYGLWKQENTGYFDATANTARTQTTPYATAGGSGWFGTVQGGCDYQFALSSWQVVVGAFADYDFANMKGQVNLPTSPFYGNEKLTDKWAVGGRIGLLITPQLLTYFSAGYTEARYDQTNFVTFVGAPPTALAGFGQYWNSRYYKGYFLGAGDEYALGFMPGLFWKTEYRFSEYDRGTNFNRFSPGSILGVGGALTGFSYDSKKWDHTVRSELVYRFNWGGSVVAKY